ncbi:hypothetical protein [Rhizobium sp. 2MFCol3.1]|uniref:hypothetical protein n=1 Tax=Rhizobium sp. 2MFCol3.1 TaxID=1246459 RepID=UPI00035C7546|nr:hypothetical protein [Rhizobium sp. 2MFCol3.1]
MSIIRKIVAALFGTQSKHVDMPKEEPAIAVTPRRAQTSVDMSEIAILPTTPRMSAKEKWHADLGPDYGVVHRQLAYAATTDHPRLVHMEIREMGRYANDFHRTVGVHNLAKEGDSYRAIVTFAFPTQDRANEVKLANG